MKPTTYEMIYAIDLKRFNMLCNQMSEKGFVHCGQPIIVNAEKFPQFYQQFKKAYVYTDKCPSKRCVKGKIVIDNVESDCTMCEGKGFVEIKDFFTVGDEMGPEPRNDHALHVP